ncbi:efflux RND transporter periplasmic adaptor subunit [Methylovirgula sp. 4M-Z18]|nr:efflux RND transporter periplasmic adaptor subunit [Methylovirgula sp. 4M-Z18]
MYAGTSLLLLAIGGTAVFLNGRSAGSTGGATAAPPPPEVTVLAMKPKAVRQWDEFTGRVAAIDAVDIRPRVTGYIDKVAFKEGSEVKAGDLLFVIDPRPYQAVLDNAQAQLERAHATADLAQIQQRRAQLLLDQKAISREDYDTRTSGLAQSSADVRAAEAAVATAKLNLDFTQVRAPISGRVSRAQMTVGNLAQADQSLLTSVVSQDPVYVYFQPDEQTYLRYSELARKGTREGTNNPVRIGLANEEGLPHQGTVNFIDNQVTSGTGTITIRAVVSNPDHVFTPGLFARVQIEGSGEFSTILIDDKAIMTDQDRKYVYVVDADNKAIRKDIEIGGVIDGERVVRAGLVAGDKVVVNGLQKIFFSGAPVKPSEQLATADAATTSAPVGATAAQ